MHKYKKLIIIVSIALVLILSVYLTLGLLIEKPGINGFSVVNGSAWLFISGGDYVKVGENRYIFRKDCLDKIMINEYDSYRYDEYYSDNDISDLPDSTLMKVGVVSKDGNEYKGVGVSIGDSDFYSLYYKPYTAD